ncbi:formimidoylglutamase [Bacillus sp. REN16]|uniref:formimidoylglutamase n=1 Tax=Bacillus sp. REN16 TaxID=2887296 RepID=UPI001E3088B6|nr:formimidoylglutamase [Bacillus sp. REN16]MCC3357263.1 formimidoylglutamase [Bacillus sp. REN16]
MTDFKYLTPGQPAIFKDKYVTKVSESIQPYIQGAKADIGIIGLPASKSSISPSLAADAPKTIRNALNAYSTFSGERNHDFKDTTILDFGDVLIHPTNLEETTERLFISVKEMLQTNACNRYIILGGDHGVSYPSIRAFKEEFGRIGVIQWDAHHDVRNLEDGGRTNGTPFRSLLEGGFLNGEDLIQIGIRDYSNAKEYHEYVKNMSVVVYTMDHVDQMGVVPILQKEINRLAQKVDFIYLSVDMDVVDQAFAPGCPAIGPGGLTSRELLAGITAAAKHPKVKAMDIVEIDPSKDVRDITSRLAAHVMMRFMYQ